MKKKKKLEPGEVRIRGKVYTFDLDDTVSTVDGCGVGWPHMAGYRGLKREDLEGGVKVKEDWRVSDE